VGHTVSGFMAFSAVMLLKCSQDVALKVAVARLMAAPAGKLTTP
jgi:hypothetical protein